MQDFAIEEVPVHPFLADYTGETRTIRVKLNFRSGFQPRIDLCGECGFQLATGFRKLWLEEKP